MKKTGYLILGFIGLGLGAIGAILPLVPSFPFLLLALYGFTRSSKRLHAWFVQTSLYQENLHSYVKQRKMTKKAKIKIMAIVTSLMGIGFIMMHRLVLAQVVLAVVWLFHIFYFTFIIKTLPSS
ncbi:MAG: YbaN family protein [Erysipelotrichaceae bacterium]|nr:YbaN family protein [Erysipelotrichaceae bacterium]MDY5252946.1 YbaN family protein [Erysipelotrichaceae bacterium]